MSLELEILKSSLERKKINALQRANFIISIISFFPILLLINRSLFNTLNLIFDELISSCILILISVIIGFQIFFIINSILVDIDKAYEKYQKGLFRQLNNKIK